MALLPKVKLKAIVSFPSAILDGAGIDVTRINGAFRFDLAYDDFTPPVSGIADPAHTNALLWNSATNAYVLAPVSVLGSAGTVPEAPSDGVQYGRQSNTWTPVSTGSTIPPATVPPLMDGAAAVGTTTKYAREDHVHPSDTSRAPTVHSHIAANVTDFSEAVDDRVAGLLVAGSNISLTYDDPGNALTIASTAAGVTDGDKGDITVSGSGTTWTIDSNTVSNAKLAQMPLFTIKANNTGFSAVPTDINIASLTTKTPAGADFLLLSDTTASGALKKTLISALPGGTSIGEAPTDGAVYSRQGSSASWVIAGGFPDGDKGDITITSSGTVWTIDSNAVTFAKIQDIATDSLIGRDTAGTGDPESITLGASLSMSGAQVLQRAALTGDVTATVDSNATTIANGTVTLAKMANLTAPVFVGRTTAGAGVPEALSPTQATAMLNVFASSLKGLVPSPAGATTTFLRADGTWAVSDDSTKVAKAGDTMTGPLNQSSPGHWAFQPPGAGSFYSSISTPDRFFVGTDLSADSFRIYSTGPAANVLTVDGLTGRVTVAVDPTAALGVATKQYVDAGDVAGLAAAGMQINGGMEVSQELGAGGRSTNGYICDGWRCGLNGTMAYVAVADANGGGVFPLFPKYRLLVSITTAQASLGAGDYTQIQQYIEGWRCERLNWGTTNAQPITIGFWTAHARTGVYSVFVHNSVDDRSYVTTYTQAVANIAQYNVVTIPGPTAGSWATDNTIGLKVGFSFGCGATFTAPSVGSWLSGNYIAAPGQVNAVAATSDNFRITGVVVLPGAQTITAAQSPLLMRSYDQELTLCKRYYQKIVRPPGTAHSNGTIQLYFWSFPFPVAMRSTPTASLSGPITFSHATGNAIASVINTNSCTADVWNAVVDTGGVITTGLAFGTAGSNTNAAIADARL
jgi:hypothetical protein